MKLILIGAALLAAYALAVHLGASEQLAGLITVVVFAETFISWAFSKEQEKQKRDQLINPASARHYATRQSQTQSQRLR